jgi:DNA polymerase-3 subunit alpha
LYLNYQKVYKTVFQNGKWAGVFQFTEDGAQNLCVQVAPTSIIDLSAITSIYRPGPLSANVHEDYIEAKKRPHLVHYYNEEYKSITEETYGFLIFQEQIALLAHKLGKNITLDEGNSLRKVLTKKGTGKTDKVLQSLYDRFIEGCVEKGMKQKEANELWEKFKFFSGYGFNKSHAVAYSVISYQCAWLLTYFESEWIAAYLEKESEANKEKAISIAKSFGFDIVDLNINTSGTDWEIGKDGKTLIQPLTVIKGLGEAAIEEIFKGRPFNTVEDFLFNKNMRYSKLNKKALDVLVRAGALDSLIDNRFTGAKHFWSAVAVDRPRKLKDLEQNIITYAPEGDFTEDEKISFLSELTGQFPITMLIGEQMLHKFDEMCIPQISEFDPDLGLAWCVVRKVIRKTSGSGKDYLQVVATDMSSIDQTIRCWAVEKSDTLQINTPYLLKASYSEQWGLSTRGSVGRSWKRVA